MRRSACHAVYVSYKWSLVQVDGSMSHPLPDSREREGKAGCPSRREGVQGWVTQGHVNNNWEGLWVGYTKVKMCRIEVCSRCEWRTYVSHDCDGHRTLIHALGTGCRNTTENGKTRPSRGCWLGRRQTGAKTRRMVSEDHETTIAKGITKKSGAWTNSERRSYV